MKTLKHLYAKQIYKVFDLLNKMEKEKNILTKQRISLQLEGAKARARDLDALRNESYQLAALMMTSYKETDLINSPGHKFSSIKKAS